MKIIENVTYLQMLSIFRTWVKAQHFWVPTIYPKKINLISECDPSFSTMYIVHTSYLSEECKDCEGESVWEISRMEAAPLRVPGAGAFPLLPCLLSYIKIRFKLMLEAILSD